MHASNGVLLFFPGNPGDRCSAAAGCKCSWGATWELLEELNCFPVSDLSSKTFLSKKMT
jgi:hypothetical protein